MNEKIQIARVCDGTTVIGKLGDDYIRDIAEVQIQMGPQGARMGLMPYFFPLNQEWTGQNIKVEKLVAVTDPPEEMAQQYAVQTSSIIPATSIPNGLKIVK